MTRIRTFASLTLLTTLFTFVDATARAQGTPPASPPAPAGAPAPAPGAPTAAPPPLSESLQGPARQAYESAKLLATNRDFGSALGEFKQAYKLSQDPRLLFNMAICEKELRHYARMKATLEQYLREGGVVMTAESKAATEEALRAIKPLIAIVHLTVSEPGAEVRIDGEVVGTTPINDPISVDTGRHQIEVRKAGFDPDQQTVETPGGTEPRVNVTLRAQRHMGQLVISADEGATVTVDGQAVGTGRYDGSLASGSHQIKVTAPGKRTYTADVDLKDGETRTMQVTLEKEGGGGAVWPWVLGGIVVVAGGAVGGYFLFKPEDKTTPVPAGKLGGVQFNVWRH